MGCYPIEYAIDDDKYQAIYIHRCPVFKSLLGDRPPYWYIKKPLYQEDEPLAWRQGLRCWYWTAEDTWAVTTPRQFATPEEAYAHFIKVNQKLWPTPVSVLQ